MLTRTLPWPRFSGLLHYPWRNLTLGETNPNIDWVDAIPVLLLRRVRACTCCGILVCFDCLCAAIESRFPRLGTNCEFYRHRREGRTDFAKCIRRSRHQEIH